MYKAVRIYSVQTAGVEMITLLMDLCNSWALCFYPVLYFYIHESASEVHFATSIRHEPIFSVSTTTHPKKIASEVEILFG
jgi:hypothetical protein